MYTSLTSQSIKRRLINQEALKNIPIIVLLIRIDFLVMKLRKLTRVTFPLSRPTKV